MHSHRLKHPSNNCSLPREKREKDEFFNAFAVSSTVRSATTSVGELILLALVNAANRYKSGETPDYLIPFRVLRLYA